MHLSPNCSPPSSWPGFPRAEAGCCGVPDTDGDTATCRGVREGAGGGRRGPAVHMGDHSWRSSPCSGQGHLAACCALASLSLTQEKDLECKPRSITYYLPKLQSALTYRGRKSLPVHRKVFRTDPTTPPDRPIVPPCHR